jgi:hypothetical protein
LHLDYLLSLRSQDHYRATAGHDLVHELAEELGFTDTTSESQALATTAEPQASDGLTLGIIVPDRQMLGEVRAGVSEAVLGLIREH